MKNSMFLTLEKNTIFNIVIYVFICIYMYWRYDYETAYPYQYIIFIISIMGFVFFVVSKNDKKNDLLNYVYYAWLFFETVTGEVLTFESQYNEIIFLFISLLMFSSIGKGQEEQEKYKIKVVRFFLTVFIDFSFFGYRLLVEDKTKQYLFMSIIVFIILLKWSSHFISFLEQLVLIFGEKLASGRLNKNHTDSHHLFIKYAIVLVLSILPGLVMSIIFYPGMFSAECVGFKNQALNIMDASVRTDISSFFYAALCAIYYNITDTCFGLTVATVVLEAVIWTDIWMFYYKKGMPFKLIVLLACLWAIIPINMFMSIALFKDTLYALLLFELTFLLVKSLEKERITIWELISIGTLLCVISLVRSNGIMALIAIWVIALLLMIGKECVKKFVVMCIVSLSCVVLIKGPLFSMLEVSATPDNFIASPFLDGVWECIYQGDSLTSDIKDYMYSIITEDDYKSKYVEGYFNYYFWPDQYYNENIDINKSVKAYKWCLVHHPYSIFKARMKKTSNIWSVFPAHENTEYRQRIFVSETWENEYGWEYIDSYEKQREKFESYYKSNNIINAIYAFIYRGGLNLVLIFCSAFILLKQGYKKILLIEAPIIGSVIALLLACCFGDYRYVWPQFGCAVIIVLFTISKSYELKCVKRLK